MVDIQKAVAEFREASARRHDASSQGCHFDNNAPNRSPVQKRLSIDNWNSGPRRGKEGAFEKQIAGKWHVITLQEVIDFVDFELYMNRFFVTYYGGCAVLFNKDTFYPDIEVNSVYLHDTRRELPDKVMEGDQGWVLQGVISRASFRRRLLSGQKTFTVLSLLIYNIHAKKRCIAKKLIFTIRAIMIGQHVYLQRGGAAVETTSAPLNKPLRTAPCQRRLALRHCGDQVRFQDAGPTCAGSWSRPSPTSTGKFDFTTLTPSHIKLQACARPIKAATTRHGSTSTSSIGATLNHITKDTIFLERMSCAVP